MIIKVLMAVLFLFLIIITISFGKICGGINTAIKIAWRE